MWNTNSPPACDTGSGGEYSLSPFLELMSRTETPNKRPCRPATNDTSTPEPCVAQVLVVFDDLDSDFGAVKLKMKGGHGGHNGMRSIIGHLNGTHNFPRLKIGIGRPADPRVSIPDHVLGHFAGDDAAALPAVLAEAAAAVEAVAALGLEVALSGKRLEV